MATTTQPNTNLSAPARPVEWGRWLLWLLAAGGVAVGLLLLAHELGRLPAVWGQAAALGAPVVLMAAGVGLMLWGWPGGRALPAFAVDRGSVAGGELVAAVSDHDLVLRAFSGSSQLAVGSFPNPRGPVVERDGAVTRVVLRPERVVPYLAGGSWDVALSRAVPWALDLRAGAGRLTLDLRELLAARVNLYSAYGGVDLTLPAQGPSEMKVQLKLGDLALTVPDGVEVKLRLAVGPLVTVTNDNRRLINVAPNEWMTPLYPATAKRCTVQVELAAGDLHLQ